MTKNKILISINDFPIFRDYEYAFSQIKNAGADGIEVIHGIKSHWPFKNTEKLSKKYNLPILSVHQPIWTGFGFPDFSFAKFAKKLGVEKIVFHPLPRLALNDKKMEEYFTKMAKLAKENKFTMLLENLPIKNQAPFIDKFFPASKESFEPLKILETAKKYGFKVTFDTSHLEDKDIGKKPWFKNVLQYTENIHLSSFTPKRAHLPLYMGDFDYKSFFKTLKNNNYKGLITLEIYYPKMIPIRGYNYSAIKKSVEIIKEELKI
jgi:sugar phosphate isomerase/epimerase